MVNPTRALVETQVRRVRRRLFFQVVVRNLLGCGAISLLLTMLWFLARPLTFADSGEEVRWSVPTGLFVLATFAGLTLAWRRQPDRVNSALALDQKFDLKERVTTFMTLSDAEIDSPAGEALLKDVAAHLSRLHVASRFPLQIAPRQLLMPTGAFALAFVAFLLDPVLCEWKISSPTVNAEEPKPMANLKEIQKQLDKLKDNVTKRGQDQAAKSKDLEAMEKEFEKLLNQPLDMKNEEKVKERINEFRNLQDRMKERMDGLKDQFAKTDALKAQLQKLDRDKLAKDGPAKDFEDALLNGDLGKAKAALKKLVNDLKNDKLDPKQQKQLAEQLKNLQEQMKKLMNEDPFMKKLKQDLKDGKIKQEDVDREVANFENLQELTKILAQTQKGLEGADGKELGKEMEKLMKRFEEMEQADRELGELMRDQKEIDAALDLFMDAIPDANGMGDPVSGAGRRPIDPNDPDGKIRADRIRTHNDAKTVQRVTGSGKGGTFNKIPAAAVEGRFRQAVQDAPDALDRQRIPEDAADIARGYFNKLGNQK